MRRRVLHRTVLLAVLLSAHTVSAETDRYIADDALIWQTLPVGYPIDPERPPTSTRVAGRPRVFNATVASAMEESSSSEDIRS